MQQRRNATLRDILYIFFKNKRIISIIFFTAVIIAAVYAFTAVPLYTADTKLLVKMGKEKFSALEDYSKTNYNVLFQERSQNINNEIEILENPALTKALFPVLKEKLKDVPVITDKTVLGVLMTVVTNAVSIVKRVIMIPFDILGLTRHMSADEQLMLRFQSSLDVEYLEDTDMLKLSFTWKDPEFAAFAVNTYAREYLYQRTQIHKSEDSYEFYVDQIQLYDRKLTEVENRLQEFISSGGIANIELQKELLLKTIAELEKRHNDALIEYRQALIKLKNVREMYRKPGMWIETPDIGEDVSDKQAYLRELDTAYFNLKLERDRLLKRYTPSAREVNSVDVQLKNLRDQKAESLINILEMDLETSESNKDRLHEELTENRQRLEKLNSLTFRLQQLERARGIAKDNFVLYKKKAEDLRIFDSLDKRLITSVKIISPALPPIAPSHPKKTLIIGMAAFLGLFLGFGFASINEFFNHSFRDDQDISIFLDIPLLMSVAYIPGEAEQGTGQGTFKKIRALFGLEKKGQQPTSSAAETTSPPEKPSFFSRFGKNRPAVKAGVILLAAFLLIAVAAALLESLGGPDTPQPKQELNGHTPQPQRTPEKPLTEQKVTTAAAPMAKLSAEHPEPAPSEYRSGADSEPPASSETPKNQIPAYEKAPPDEEPLQEPELQTAAQKTAAAKQQESTDGSKNKAPITDIAAEPGDTCYTVQVSTERIKENVDSFVKQLQLKDYPAYVQQRSTRAGDPLYKIRIGTYQTREQAEKTARRYHEDTGKPYLIVRSSGRVPMPGDSGNDTAHEPDSRKAGTGPAPASEAADNQTSEYFYTVQTNTYVNESNARREIVQLRDAGLSPYIRIEETAGRTLYKVCAGDFATRQEAVQHKTDHNLNKAIIVRYAHEQQN